MPGRNHGQPGPDDGVPVVGGSRWLGAAGKMRRDLLGTFERAMLTHGSRARLQIGLKRLGFVADAIFTPELARQVLATDAALYDKDVPALIEFRRFVGDGLLTSDGERWRRDRRIVAPLFTRKRIESYVPAMAITADGVVASWQDAAAVGGAVDVCEPSMLYALEVLGAAVFGEDIHEAEAVVRRSVPVLNAHVTHTALSPVRLPSWVPTPAHRRVHRARREVWDFVEHLIADRRRGGSDGDAGTSTASARNDLLSLLLGAKDPETGAGLDDLAVRDQALIFLLAGHETTGATLAFALHLLGRHPDVQERVRDEVLGVVGGRAISASDVHQLTYTEQVINETMRLYPAGHTLARRSRQAATLAGHQIPAKRIVAISVWAVHHNPSVWPDPYRFDPDRFAGAGAGGECGSEAEKTARYAHLPFGGGPRRCIGQYLAMAELVVAVATIVRAFHLESLDDEPALDVGVSLLPGDRLLCRIRRTGLPPDPAGGDVGPSQGGANTAR